MKIDIFNHFSPKAYNDKMLSMTPETKDMIGKRIRNIPALVDLDVRFKVMDMFDEYVQVLSMPTPLEAFCTPPQAREVARVGIAAGSRAGPPPMPRAEGSRPVNKDDMAGRVQGELLVIRWKSTASREKRSRAGEVTRSLP